MNPNIMQINRSLVSLSLINVLVLIIGDEQ